MTYSCLVIERDQALADRMARELPENGFKPFISDSSESALDILRQWSFDAALVDADGFGPGYVSVLRRLRPEFRSPLVLLSQPQDERDQLLSLESGATEIVTKPASTRLLAAKMRRLIEVSGRESEAEADQVQLGPLTMHARRGITTVGDVPLKLTVHQFELLFLLASKAGQFVDRETIAMRLRGTPGEIGRSADVHVYRIRRKLKELGIDCLRLDTVYGRGYTLALEEGAIAKKTEVAAPLTMT